MISGVQPVPVASKSEVVDEFGELERQVTDFAPVAKRHKYLQETIRGWHSEHPADQSSTVEGAIYKVLVSARSEERSLDIKAKSKIYAAVGKAAFLSLVNLTLKAATVAVGEAKVDELSTKERTGSRKLTVVAKAPATGQKAA